MASSGGNGFPYGKSDSSKLTKFIKEGRDYIDCTTIQSELLSVAYAKTFSKFRQDMMVDIKIIGNSWIYKSS